MFCSNSGGSGTNDVALTTTPEAAKPICHHKQLEAKTKAKGENRTKIRPTLKENRVA